jgi:hypothetical protein
MRGEAIQRGTAASLLRTSPLPPVGGEGSGVGVAPKDFERFAGSFALTEPTR